MMMMIMIMIFCSHYYCGSILEYVVISYHYHYHCHCDCYVLTDYDVCYGLLDRCTGIQLIDMELLESSVDIMKTHILTVLSLS